MRFITLITRLVAVGGIFTAFWALLLAGALDYDRHSTRPAMRRLGRGGPAPGGALVSAGGGGGGAGGGGGGGGGGPFSFPKDFKYYISPRPSPSAEPEVYNLRNCECVDDWKAKRGQSVCTCNGAACAPKVDPKFLTEAVGQDVCSLRRHTGYLCTVGCRGEEVFWYGKSCGGAGQEECAPLVSTPSATPTASKTNRPPIVVPEVTWDPKEVWDLRGAQCEIIDGKERCFTEDSQGREMCPDFVTSEYLAWPKAGVAPYECGPEMTHQYYCTIQCQQGNNVVRWWPQSVAWCYGEENYGNCPSRQPVVPKAEFTVKPKSTPDPSPFPCQEAHRRGIKPPGKIRGLSVGVLTHESTNLRYSFKTYDENGLFGLVEEFLVYINNRRPEVENLVAEYQAKYPGVIRVLGDSSNVGIARGMVHLTNNATKPHFLFLERDFWLIEPATCVYEQLAAGVKMLEGGAADVVRYRHRRHAGRPNWAENFFKGHEDDAFVGRQPNLGCNIYYWIWDVETRYPDYFWRCGDDPEMTCSDSFYCNWTNNPQMWSVEWWNREYVSQFDAFKRNDPWYDLESYMNWEPNSWNDRKFTVAQGEGLFKHIDRTKF